MKEEQFEILVGLINETNAKVDDIKENLNITNAEVKKIKEELEVINL